MENKNTNDKKTNCLSGFISSLGNNMGISLSGSKKKEKFNPYSAKNQQQVQEIFDTMTSYQTKTGEANINIPKNVTVSKNNKRINFEFDKELKADIFDEIVEERGFKNISMDQSSKVVEITK